MSQTPSELKYATSHEWARLEEDGTITVGISDHAQDALGDVVFVELPEVGVSISAGDSVAVIESVKAASDTYAPVSGEIIEINEELEDSPERINDDPYGDGWMYRVKMEDPGEANDLLDADSYSESIVDDE